MTPYTDIEVTDTYIIWEFGTATNPDWVHVSYESNGRQRKQILKAVRVNGKTTYKPWS